MRIGIDASRAFFAERTGTEEYSHELIRHLAAIAPSGQEITLYVRQGARLDFPLPATWRVRELPGRFLWSQWHLCWELLKRPMDALFVPAHAVPLVHPRRTTVTVHGLEFRYMPECYRPQERFLLRLNTLLSLLWAQRIIVPSESSKQDLMKFYRVNSEKITVIPHGVTLPAATPSPKKDDTFNILFIGRLERRKNVVRMVKAFDLFLDDLAEETQKKVTLTLAGKPGFGYEELIEAVGASAHKERIRLPGYVDDERKRELFSSADVFLFPSRSEGFGLPILEAMSYGVPVIGSELASFEEVAGEAALLIDPSDTEGMAAALTRLFREPSSRGELIEKGRQNIQRFDWKRCAGMTLDTITKD